MKYFWMKLFLVLTNLYSTLFSQLISGVVSSDCPLLSVHYFKYLQVLEVCIKEERIIGYVRDLSHYI